MNKTDLHVRLPDQIDERLQSAKEETGLSKSEITRKGIVQQLNELEV